MQDERPLEGFGDPNAVERLVLGLRADLDDGSIRLGCCSRKCRERDAHGGELGQHREVRSKSLPFADLPIHSGFHLPFVVKSVQAGYLPMSAPPKSSMVMVKRTTPSSHRN